MLQKEKRRRRIDYARDSIRLDVRKGNLLLSAKFYLVTLINKYNLTSTKLFPNAAIIYYRQQQYIQY